MKAEGRNAVLELLKTDKNIDKILMEKNNLITAIFQKRLWKNIQRY